MSNLEPILKPSLWRQILRQNFTQWHPLAAYLELTECQLGLILKQPKFVLNLPLRLAEKVKKGDINDPILKQFLPTTHETQTADNFLNDPVGDSLCQKSSKFLQKYEGRVLLVCTSACAMHCRYCFRQNFNYDIEKTAFAEELKLIQADTSIHEVILSGGDPLSLSDSILENLLQNLDAIPHIKRIRFHTRFPIGIPERIDTDFINMLRKIRCQIWFVIHTNHPNELDATIFYHLKQLQQLGIIVLNQSVLLKGINDDVETQYRLCELLVNHGVMPYYLHQLDRVQGAMHFEVDEKIGHKIIKELTARLPGYAVPKYVREVPGEQSKTSL